jgi:uncharacterized caspase-like protein
MSRPVLIAAAVALWLFCAPVSPAFAGDRLALVIGNSAYQNTPALPNPTKDAQAIAARFKEVGFKVISAHYDVTNVAFKRAIRDFEDAVASSDPEVIVIYYAGHGIEIGGTNYMLPVDAKLASTRDAHDEAITLDRLLEATEGAKQLSLVILDACRDNPFVNMKRPKTAMLRAVRSGLAPVEPVNSNTLIAYATKTGSGAEDGTGEHSPFTVALMNHLFVPGLDVRLAFGRVRDDVMKKTRNRQEPYVTGSVGGELLTVVPAKATPAPVAATPDRSVAAAAERGDGERTDYQLVAQVGTKRAWEVFLNQHPKGMYAELAREQIQKLASLDVPKTPAPVPAGPTTEEQRAWDRIKDSSNAALLRDFIKRYPTSPLANTAQTKLDALEQEAARQKAERDAAAKREEEERQAKAAEAARQKAEREAALKREEAERRAKAAAEAERQRAEREEKARLEREAQAAELARQKVEREAALKREEEERKVKAAEAERQRLEREERARIEREAKAAEAARLKAEREAALKREEETRKAQAAEADRLHREREAALKREEEERKARAASEAERQRIEQEAALKRADEERQVKAAEAERQRTEREAALKRAEDERRAKAEETARLKAEADEKARVEREAKAAEAARQKAEREAALKREQLERQAKAAEDARQKAEREAALRREQEEHRAKAAADAARQKAEREAALKREQEERQAKVELVRIAQNELSRLGCFVGTADGNLSSATKAALKRYETGRGKPVADIEITERFVTELQEQSGRVCSLVCPTGQVVEGERCIAAQKPVPVAVQKPIPVAKQKDYDEDERRPRARQEETRTRPVARQRDEDRPARRREEPKPRVRQEASSARHSSGGGGGRYSGGGGGGGGGGHGPIGVGF